MSGGLELARAGMMSCEALAQQRVVEDEDIHIAAENGERKGRYHTLAAGRLMRTHFSVQEVAGVMCCCFSGGFSGRSWLAVSV